jgi:HTH-type transcriptional regulator/antitoxin HigA
MNSEPLLMPGDEIRKELHKRGWTQDVLSQVLNRPLPTINQIIQGKRAITPDMAVALGAAFGDGAEKWMQLESSYRLSLAKVNPDPVQRRAKLYAYAPIKDMQRRSWIKQVEDVDEQERIVCKFFGINSLEEEPVINAAMREATRSLELNPIQKAWCFRAKYLAKALRISTFNKTTCHKILPQLRELAIYPEEVRHVPKILAEYGIRFLVIEPLPSSRIDGAAIWLDADSPVIALSLRYDRIDAFWFTLMHELSHILHSDLSVDEALFCGEGEQVPSIIKNNIERRADNEAAASLIPPDKLDSFILRISPLYSKTRINQFANRLKIHHGIIVGQLQHRGEMGYSTNREMLVKVREIIASSAVTDGWGRIIAINETVGAKYAAKTTKN